MRKWQYVRLKIMFKGHEKKIIYKEDGKKSTILSFPCASEEHEQEIKVTIEGMQLNGWELINTKKDYFYFKRAIE